VHSNRYGINYQTSFIIKSSGHYCTDVCQDSLTFDRLDFTYYKVKHHFKISTEGFNATTLKRQAIRRERFLRCHRNKKPQPTKLRSDGQTWHEFCALHAGHLHITKLIQHLKLIIYAKLNQNNPQKFGFLRIEPPARPLPSPQSNLPIIKNQYVLPADMSPTWYEKYKDYIPNYRIFSSFKKREYPPGHKGWYKYIS